MPCRNEITYIYGLRKTFSSTFLENCVGGERSSIEKPGSGFKRGETKTNPGKHCFKGSQEGRSQEGDSGEGKRKKSGPGISRAV